MSLLNDKSIRLAYNYTSIVQQMVNRVITWLPTNVNSEFIIICIGTDRSTGDSLGPFTGTLLQDKTLRNITVYGNLHDPVHALNLEKHIMMIRHKYNNPFIIAIDACLGKMSSVGDVIAGTGSILPGAAVNKQLPAVGDMFITGVINVSGFLEYTVLQSTRLSLVLDMAKTIAQIVEAIDRQITLQKFKATIEKRIL